MEQNSILFIGNGFDLKYGRKTSYKDFIESRYDLHKLVLEKVESEFEYIILKEDALDKLKKYLTEINSTEYDENTLDFIGKLISKISEVDNFTHNKTFSDIITMEEYLNLIRLKGYNYDPIYTNKVRNRNGGIIFVANNISVNNWRMYNKKFLDSLNVNYEKIKSIDSTNTWIEYFQYLYYRKDDKIVENYKEFFKYGKWLDLENIIKYNFDSKYLNDDLAPTYNKHMKLKEIENTEEGKKVSFQEMKKELASYLMFKSSSIDLIDFDTRVLNKYTNKVSFNYTRIFNYKDPKSKEYFHIHGNINNDENIVFGFDESELFLNSGQKLSDEGVLYTKVDQIIELNDKRVNKDINHFKERYDRLGIYGLSMGVPDYSYYSNVILKNLDNIIIEIYYSDTEMCRNKQELRQSFYHLMKYIETLAGKPLYHEMIISNRVKFIKQEYN